MVIHILQEDTILEMAKLVPDYADESLCGDFGDFVYFSPCLDAHGPRVKFYGGTKETSTTRNAPSLAFTNTGETTVEVANWMDKKNCPNAFNAKYVQKVHNFIQRTLPILLLVWYFKIDEARALKYFEGAISLEKLLTYLTDIDEKHIKNIQKLTTLNDIHKYCIDNNVYTFN